MIENNEKSKSSSADKKSTEPKGSKTASVNELRLFLSDTFVLYMKTYAVHWNFEGSKFFSVHKMTEEQYQQLAEAVDEIAERIRALGEKAPVSLHEILGSADLNEFKHNSDGDKAISELWHTNEKLSALARELSIKVSEAGDVFTADMLTRRVGAHDKAAWMLRSFLGNTH